MYILDRRLFTQSLHFPLHSNRHTCSFRLDFHSTSPNRLGQKRNIHWPAISFTVFHYAHHLLSLLPCLVSFCPVLMCFVSYYLCMVNVAATNTADISTCRAGHLDTKQETLTALQFTNTTFKLTLIVIPSDVALPEALLFKQNMTDASSCLLRLVDSCFSTAKYLTFLKLSCSLAIIQAGQFGLRGIWSCHRLFNQ